jgi:hypothetical protein
MSSGKYAFLCPVALKRGRARPGSSPRRVPVRLDDHAATHDLGGSRRGHPVDDVLIPLGIVFAAARQAGRGVLPPHAPGTQHQEVHPPGVAQHQADLRQGAATRPPVQRVRELKQGDGPERVRHHLQAQELRVLLPRSVERRGLWLRERRLRRQRAEGDAVDQAGAAHRLSGHARPGHHRQPKALVPARPRRVHRLGLGPKPVHDGGRQSLRSR